MTEITKRELHLRYVVAILVLALLEVLTILLIGGGEQILSFITFGVTLTAGVLAVVTIIYTYISNATLSGTVASMQELGRQVSESASRLGKAEQSIDDATKRLSDEVTGHLGRIEKDTQLIPGLAKKLEESQRVASPPGKKVQAEAVDLPDAVVREFVRRSPFSGLLTLQAAVLAKEFKAKLKPSLLTEIGALSEDGYFLAYLGASYSAQLLDLDEENNQYLIGTVNATMAAEVGPEIDRRIAKEEGPVRDRWAGCVVNLRRMLTGKTAESGLEPPEAGK